MSGQSSQVKIYKASQALQQRVGKVSFDQSVIDRTQNVIERNVQDFTPMAKLFLDTLSCAIEQAQNTVISQDKRLAAVVEPIMELKANAKMFKYDLVSSLASIMLAFVETLKDIDKDALAILEAHHRTLSVIVLKNMKGPGGAVGETMLKELQDVCQRYFQKRG